MNDQYPTNNPHQPQPYDPVAQAYQPAPETPAPAPQPEPAPEPAPTRLDPAALRARKRREQEGYDFILRATTDEHGNPTVARVRRPDIFDADTLEGLPDAIQTRIFGVIEEAEKAESAGGPQAMEESVTELLKRNYGAFAAMADAYVIAGFIEPRVYPTAAEADANGGLWVKDIERADRIAFYHHCTGMVTEATEGVAGFREQPHDAVDAGPAGPEVSGQPAQLIDWPAGPSGTPGV